MKRILLVALVATTLSCSSALAQCNLLGRFVGRSGCGCGQATCCETPAATCDACDSGGCCKLFDFNLHFSMGGCRVRGLFPLFGGGCDTGCGGCDTGCGGAANVCDRGSLLGRFHRGGCGQCGGGDTGCGNDTGCGCGGGLLQGRLFSGGLFARFGGCGCGGDTGCGDCGGCDSGCDSGCGGCGSRLLHLGLMDRIRSIGRRGCGECNSCGNAGGDPCQNTGCGCGGDHPGPTMINPIMTPTPNGAPGEGTMPSTEPQTNPPQGAPASNSSSSRNRIVPIVDPSAFRAPAARFTSSRAK